MIDDLSNEEYVERDFIKIYNKQQLFYELNCGIQGFVGGRGIGKTKIGCIKLINLAANKQPWMVISPDANVIEDTTWPTFEETAQELGVWKKGVRSPVHRAWIKTFDGGETNVLFRGAEKPEKLRGPSKAGIWFDEASIMAKEAYLYAIPCLRCMTPTGPKMGPCLMTFTPKGRSHWTFDVFFEPSGAEEAAVFGKERKTPGLLRGGDYIEIGGSWYKMRENTSLVTAATTESPFLPEEFYDRLRGQYNTMLAAQELGGEFVDIEGLMFRREWFANRFLDDPEIVREFPKECLRVRYWDLAGTEDDGCWTVGTLLAKSPSGKFLIEDVVSGQWGAMTRDAMMKDTANRDDAMYGNAVIIYVEQEGGSAGKWQAQQQIRMLAGHPVYKDIPTRARGTQLKEGQKVPGFAKIIRARPVSAQAEAGNVYLPRNANWRQQPLNDVLACYCIAPDSRVCTISGWKPVKSVYAGDFVLTRKGWKRVSKCWMTHRHAIVGSIETENGMKLRCTASHPVYVEGMGFVSASTIRRGERLVSCIEAHGFGCIHLPSQLLSANTFRDGTTNEMLNFTDKYISMQSERCQKEFMSITSMATLATIDLRICVPRQLENTFLDIKAKISSVTNTPQELLRAKFADRNTGLLSLQEAIRVALNVGEFGTKRITHGRQGTNLLVSLVEGNACHFEEADSTVLCSVLENTRGQQAKTNTEPHPDQGRVQYAESHILGMGTSRKLVQENVVKSWQPESVQEVWNLKVEECPEYFAEGLLTHNCGFPETRRMDEVDSLSGAFNRIQERSVADPGAIVAVAGRSRIGDKYGQGMGAGILPSFFDASGSRKFHSAVNFVRHN